MHRTTNPEREGPISEAEDRKLWTALAWGQGGSFTEDEAMRLHRWAEYVRVSAMCLDMVLRGELLCRMRPDGDTHQVAHPDEPLLVRPGWEDEPGRQVGQPALDLVPSNAR